MPQGPVGALVISAVLLVLAGAAIYFSAKKRAKNKESDNATDTYFSNEAIEVGGELLLQFDSLVSAIACENTRKAGKLLTHKEADEGLFMDKFISPEDVEVAFLEAARLVLEKCALDRCPCKTNCDKQTVLQKIRNIHKNLEKISQTP